MGSFAMTEPVSGADIENYGRMHGKTIGTTATLDGDDWVINGHKIWPSNSGHLGDLYTVVCTTNKGSTNPDDIAALGSSDTVAVALPCTPFGLAEADYTPAQAILEASGILAIATDLNPGTAWCENMQFAIALACRYMGLTPAQAIAAATINAAAAISRSERVGSLEVGKQADLILLDVPDYRHLGYRFGTNLVSLVVKKGVILNTYMKKET